MHGNPLQEIKENIEAIHCDRHYGLPNGKGFFITCGVGFDLLCSLGKS